MHKFGNAPHREQSVYVNIYADESIYRKCPYNEYIWNYIGIIVEDLSNPLLNEIIYERFRGNYDKYSKYYKKNNKIVHWNEISSADEKNICMRWFKFILDPLKSSQCFYSYILGLNDSFLNKDEFDNKNEFISKYNRFFRTSVLYALKCFFIDKNIIIENIYHEEGEQQFDELFPWHIIYKLKDDEQISFNCKNITFLPKDHKEDKRSNLIQLCDIVLGVSTSIIHGIKKSNNSLYREELADFYAPLIERIINAPNNYNSRYQYANRIMVSFFPKVKTDLGDRRRLKDQFYTKRNLYYLDQKNDQMKLF